ncbi:hypothetical protein HMPREF6123_1250, partial [Oribacterium sinus F0268]
SISRFSLLISTILPTAVFRKYRRARIVPLSYLYCFCRLSLLISTVLPFDGFLQISVSSDCPSYRPILH